MEPSRALWDSPRDRHSNSNQSQIYLGTSVSRRARIGCLSPQLFARATGPTVLALAQPSNLSSVCLHATQQSSDQLLYTSLREQCISLAHSRLLQLRRVPTHQRNERMQRAFGTMGLQRTNSVVADAASIRALYNPTQLVTSVTN